MIKTAKLGPYRGYVGRAWYCESGDNKFEPQPYSDFTRIVVTNMRYMRGSGLRGRACQSKVDAYFMMLVDSLLASYIDHGEQPPPPSEHETDWAGQPCNWEQPSKEALSNHLSEIEITAKARDVTSVWDDGHKKHQRIEN